MNADTILLENLVALDLFRRYGRDDDNQTVWFYSDNIEVDFYVPEEKLAIQASYSILGDETRERETEGLRKLPKVHPCERRVIITYDEEETISDALGTIEVIPYWKWALK